MVVRAKGIRYAVVGLLTLMASTAAPQSEPLPDELTHLTKLTGNEEELVDAVRRFHRQQVALYQWDKELMASYRDENQTALMQVKAEDMRRRVNLMLRGWQFVLDHYPNNARANNYYGEILYDYRGQQAGAVRRWSMAVQFDDECAPAHNNLGIHYMHVGNYDKGLMHLGKALDLEPKNPDFLFNITQMYLTYFPQIERRYDKSREKIYKEAMRHSKNAAKYAPNDFDLLQDYATNFYASENFGVEVDWTKAAQAWRDARPHARNSEERFYTFLNEGRSWMRAGKPEEAVTAFEQALAMRPDSDVTKNLLEKARNAKAPAS